MASPFQTPLLTNQQLILYKREQRRTVRSITRTALGTLISTILTIFMPWQAISSLANAVMLYRNARCLKRLKDEMAKYGLRVRKRYIARGIVEGGLLKTASLVLTFGHDDVALLIDGIDHAATVVIDHVEVLPSADGSVGLVNDEEILAADRALRMDHGFVEFASEAAGMPAEITQDLLGVHDSAALAGAHVPAWSAGPTEVIQQVVVVGAVQVVTEQIVDKVLEGPIVTVIDKTDEKYRGWTVSGDEKQGRA